MARRVTIVDVAREAGVAISTVSAALNGRDGVSASTRERVTAIAEQLGWVPSMRGRSLVSKRAWAVGLMIQRPASVLEADPFVAGFLGGAMAWWTLLACVISLFRRRFRPRHMLTINHVAGLIIGILGIYTILSTFYAIFPNVGH